MSGDQESMNRPAAVWHLRATVLLSGHIVAMCFGLFGLIVAIPQVAISGTSSWTNRVYDFGVAYGGLFHIGLGSLAMLAYGISARGRQATLRFFAIVFILSLTMEYVGVRTGWPFGDYRYSDDLGLRIFGTVPFAVPLSWCYMGLAATYLSAWLIPANPHRLAPLVSLMLAIGLLVVWDLGLELAVAHEAASIQYWVWDEEGPYFGVPIMNFMGWALTACLCFMACRFAGVLPDRRHQKPWLPAAIYASISRSLQWSP